MRFTASATAAFFALTLASPFLVPAIAQEAPSPTGPPPKSNAPVQVEEENNPLQTLKIGTNLVNVYFSARDKSGYITDLKKEDCLLTETPEHGKPEGQVIKNFTQEKKLPLTIGILLDTSGSQVNVLGIEKDSGAEFLKDVLTPKDEAFLISFDINVNLLADYTNSPSEIRRAMNSAQINTGITSGSVTGNSNSGGTHLYDAVYLAATEKLRPEAGRKVVVMLTDGGEQGSQETLKSTIEAAQKANVIVYVILIADRGFYGHIGMGYSGDRDMEQLSHDTGGRVINVGNNGNKLKAAFDQIQDELRTQYLLSYTPKNLEMDGKFRNIHLDCGKALALQTRKGYYAIPDGDNGGN
jgi:VWFA-related protein